MVETSTMKGAPMDKPNKYEQDLRFDPAPEDAADTELEARAEKLIDAVLSGAGNRSRPDNQRRKDSS